MVITARVDRQLIDPDTQPLVCHYTNLRCLQSKFVVERIQNCIRFGGGYCKGQLVVLAAIQNEVMWVAAVGRAVARQDWCDRERFRRDVNAKIAERSDVAQVL